jgi:hypothetical protein
MRNRTVRGLPLRRQLEEFARVGAIHMWVRSGIVVPIGGVQAVPAQTTWKNLKACLQGSGFASGTSIADFFSGFF